MTALRPRRPGGVTLLIVLLWLQALIGIAGGVVLIVVRHAASVQHNTHRSASTLVAVGIVILALGVITALIASSLGRGSNLARWIVVIVSLLQLVGAILTLIRVQGDTRIGAIVDGVIALVILYVLFGERGSQEFFTGRALAR